MSRKISVGWPWVHAHHLLRFVTGCEVEAVSASLATVVPGRTSHDDAQVALRLSGGARGALWASYVAAGCRNGLRLMVCGETGTLDSPPEILVDLRKVVPHRARRGA